MQSEKRLTIMSDHVHEREHRPFSDVKIDWNPRRRKWTPWAQYHQEPALRIPQFWDEEQAEAAVLLPRTLVETFKGLDEAFRCGFNQLACDMRTLAYTAFVHSTVSPQRLDLLDLLLPYRRSATDGLLNSVAMEGSTEVVELLTARGIDLTLPVNGYDGGFLGAAVDWNNLPIVEYVLSSDAMARAGIVFKPRSPDTLPLLLCAYTFKMAILLRDAGCPLRGTNALHLAAVHGTVDVVRLLLEIGADPNEACNEDRIVGCRFYDLCGDEHTLLECAAKNCLPTIAKLLLEYGAGPLTRDSKGQTMHAMAFESYQESADDLSSESKAIWYDIGKTLRQHVREATLRESQSLKPRAQPT